VVRRLNRAAVRGTGVAPVVAGGVDANGLPRELTDPKSKLSQRSIYFDLDKYEVKDEYKDLVASHAKYLVANRGFKVLLQGNTDERGSREYNLSLGQKRAEAVKRSLSCSAPRKTRSNPSASAKKSRRMPVMTNRPGPKTVVPTFCTRLLTAAASSDHAARSASPF
jgi:hypothetical protein